MQVYSDCMHVESIVYLLDPPISSRMNAAVYIFNMLVTEEMVFTRIQTAVRSPCVLISHLSAVLCLTAFLTLFWMYGTF